MYCTKCGCQVSDDFNFCANCANPIKQGEVSSVDEQTAMKASPNTAYPQQTADTYNNNPYNNCVYSNRSRAAAALLCFFLGFLGIHRFYVGKVGTGVLWLLTGGLFGIGSFVDFIVILCGGFKDGEGYLIKKKRSVPLDNSQSNLAPNSQASSSGSSMKGIGVGLLIVGLILGVLTIRFFSTNGGILGYNVLGVYGYTRETGIALGILSIATFVPGICFIATSNKSKR